MPLTTPFHPRLASLNRTGLWKHWAGYLVAPRYQDSLNLEYYAIRNAVSLLDTSPLFKYRITGADAEALLKRVLTRDIGGCEVGRAQYTCWCDERGFVLQDGVVMRVAPDEYWLTAADPALRYFRQTARDLGYRALRVDDLSTEFGILALQGPHAYHVLAALTEAVSGLRYFGVARAEIAGRAVTVSRTGYTGDLGFELWVGREDALAVWDALVAEGKGYNLTPIGTTALKMARVEAGLLLMGVDFHTSRFGWVDAQRETPPRAGVGMDAAVAGPRRAGLHRTPRHRRRAESRHQSMEDGRPCRRLARLRAGLLGSGHPATPPRGVRGNDHERVSARGEGMGLRRVREQLPHLQPASKADRHRQAARRSDRARLGGGPGGHRDPPTPERAGSRRAATLLQPTTQDCCAERGGRVMPSEAWDAIVVGGGHNGLVNAAYLARAGLKTLVLEKRHLVGGAAITEELVPGFRFTTFSYAISLMRPDVVQDLDLAKHGMMVLPLVNTFQPGLNGEYLFLGADPDANYHEIARHSAEDAESARDLDHLIARVARSLKPWMDRIPPNSRSEDPDELAAIAELRDYVARLDPRVRSLLEKFTTSSAAEILDEYFENDLVKSLYASSGIIGTKVGPRDRESGIIWLIHKLGDYDGVPGAWGFHKGGNGGFTQVLARAVEAFGGAIRTNAGVEQVLYESGEAAGVRLEDGSVLRARVVVSALDPRQTFMRLVDPADLPGDLVRHITEYKFQGSAAKVNFALSDTPTFPGLEGRDDIFQGFTNLGPSIEYLDEAFADCQAGRFSRRPFLDCCVQSTLDPDMSPPGKHVMSCFVMYAPYHLAESDWETERENLGDTVQATVEEFFPGFGDLVLHREIVTPLDIESLVGLSEGNIFAGELFESQLFFNRPAPGWNQYRTPIAGYYQCGSGTHPGGCVTGGPGKLAAQQILGDRAGQRGT